jgi:hypothetical protein
MIDLADFVEAHILGIAVIEESKTINVTFRSQAQQRFVLVAEGVDRFIANEFREQNIVDRAELWDSTSEPDSYRESLASLVSGGDEYSDGPTWRTLVDKEIALIQRGEKIFVSIEAAYGASVALLAKKVAMTR